MTLILVQAERAKHDGEQKTSRPSACPFPKGEQIDESRADMREWWIRDGLPVRHENLLQIRKAVGLLSSVRKSNSAVCPLVTDDYDRRPPNLSIVPQNPSRDQEKDFTTSGTPSKLNCPFAVTAGGKLTAHAASVLSRYQTSGSVTGKSLASHGIRQGSVTSPTQITVQSMESGQTGHVEETKKSVDDLESSLLTSGLVCPIRFLETKKPEEIANYFEKHKHELPKSHELCVKRNQSDTERIRQLDAQYGSLVSMISGLGQKHVPMLPDKIEEREEDSDSRVRIWAKDIDGSQPPPGEAEDNGGRMSHFDRPMREVRLGESPSRPWGVHLPTQVEPGITTDHSKPEQRPEHIEVERAPKQPLKCPVAHKSNDIKGAKIDQNMKDNQADPVHMPPLVIPEIAQILSGNDTRPIVFQGPVFIGYSVDQATAILKGFQQG